jgi:chromosome segregation ATPase
MTTDTVERNLEQLGERLEAAKEVEQGLLKELADMPARLREAATESAQAFREATEAGRDPHEGAELQDTRRRAEELPTLVWSAALARLGAQIEYHEARAAEAKEAQYRASGEAEKLGKKRFELQEQIEDLRDVMHAENNDARDHRGYAKRARRERAALERRGPGEGFDAAS